MFENGARVDVALFDEQLGLAAALPAQVLAAHAPLLLVALVILALLRPLDLRNADCVRIDPLVVQKNNQK